MSRRHRAQRHVHAVEVDGELLHRHGAIAQTLHMQRHAVIATGQRLGQEREAVNGHVRALREPLVGLDPAGHHVFRHGDGDPVRDHEQAEDDEHDDDGAAHDGNQPSRIRPVT